MEVAGPSCFLPIPQDKDVGPETGYIGYFLHCCYQMPGKGNLKKEGARFKRRYSLLWREDEVIETGVAAHLHRPSGSRELNPGLSLFPPFILHSAYGMIPLTLTVGLPSLVSMSPS